MQIDRRGAGSWADLPARLARTALHGMTRCMGGRRRKRHAVLCHRLVRVSLGESFSLQALYLDCFKKQSLPGRAHFARTPR